MLVEDLEDYFRLLVDEPEQDAITNKQFEVLADQAYRRFRERVEYYAPGTFSNEVNIQPTGSQYDLSDSNNAVRLFGKDANLKNGVGPGGSDVRAMLLYFVGDWDGSDPLTFDAREWVSHPDALETTPYSVMLKGPILQFSEDLDSQDVRVIFLPEHSVDFSKTTSGDNEFIDDLTDFHDTIALLMAVDYQAIDGTSNSVLNQKLQGRMGDLRDHLMARAPLPRKIRLRQTHPAYRHAFGAGLPISAED